MVKFPVMIRKILFFMAAVTLLGCNASPENESSEGTSSPREASSNAGNTDEKKKPLTTIAFDKMLHHFGKIAPDRDYIAKFKITNTGNNPLYISDVNPICGCTVSDWNKEAIAPGKSDVIQLTYHPGPSLSGPQHKTATVFFNTKEEFAVLDLKAEVIKK